MRSQVRIGLGHRILSGTIILAAIASIVILAPIYFLEPLSTAILISNVLGIVLLFAVGFNRAYGKPLPLRFVNGGAAAVVRTDHRLDNNLPRGLVPARWLTGRRSFDLTTY